MRITLFIFLSVFISICLYGQVNLSTGLVGYYPFNNNANDASGNNYNGILRNGVTFSADRTGNPNSAAYFDGNDDYIEIPNNGAFSPRKGFSFVVQFKSESPAIQTLLDKRDLVTGTDVQFQAFINWDQQPGFGYGHNYTNNAQCNIAVSQYNLYVSTGINTINQNEWYCVIGTFDGSKQNIYLNGVLMDSKSSPLSLIDSCGNIPLIIGRHSDAYTQSFKGTIDEVRIYNRPLTQDEINLLSPCKIQQPEICDNGIDDDGDGLIDCADPDCLSCSSPCGPIPSINPKIFNTANNGKGGLIPLNSSDLHWKVSDTLNGLTRNAIYTGNCVPGYWTPSPFPDAGWIVDQQIGTCGIVYPQSSTSPRYFTTTFDVPPSLSSSLKLSFDVYADNYLNEVYLNGVPLGINKTSGDLYCAGCNISFTINSGFVPGTNTLTFLITQRSLPDNSPPSQYMGFLLNASSTLDSDNDGVPDGKDICPGTPPGVSVDTNGCFKLMISKTGGKCIGDSLVLESSEAGAGAIYNWEKPDKQIIAGRKIVINNLTTSDNGKYKLIITDNYSCVKYDSIDIIVNQKPVINLNAIYTVCQGSSIQLNATGGNSYQWTPTAGLNNPQIANPVALTDTTTTYTVIATNTAGCLDSSSTTLKVNARPIPAVSRDTSVCKGGSIQLLASGGISYLWSPAISLNNASIPNPVATPQATTDFKVIVSNSTGCKDSAITIIKVNSKPIINISPDIILCSTDSAQLSAEGGISYFWSPPDGMSNVYLQNPKVFPSATTSYQVVVTNIFNCMDTAFTKVTVNPTPNIRITKSNDIDCSSPTAELTISGGRNYSWRPSQFLNNTNTSKVIASPSKSTTFYVDWVDKNGCSGTDSVYISVKNNGSISYLLPNSFTPNGDGVNDCFGLKKWGGITLLDFSIYNRWGEKVFGTTDPTKCWDGTYKGVEQPIGTFVYFIHAKSFCGEISRKGTITIIR